MLLYYKCVFSVPKFFFQAAKKGNYYRYLSLGKEVNWSMEKIRAGLLIPHLMKCRVSSRGSDSEENTNE